MDVHYSAAPSAPPAYDTIQSKYSVVKWEHVKWFAVLAAGFILILIIILLGYPFLQEYARCKPANQTTVNISIDSKVELHQHHHYPTPGPVLVSEPEPTLEPTTASSLHYEVTVTQSPLSQGSTIGRSAYLNLVLCLCYFSSAAF